MTKTYNWQRFWLASESTPYLDDDAYLPDPTGKYQSIFNPDASDLLKMVNLPCKILLGESGMGKSSALRTDFVRLEEHWKASGDRGALIDIGAATSIADVRSQIKDHKEVQEWRWSGAGILHLNIDSLDEAIPAYSAVSKGLMTIVKELGHERLRLSIACRAGEFPPFLERELVSYFGSTNVTRWQLAPLTRADIVSAAAENGVDADTFIQAVWEGNLQPLAARPITLDLLLRVARSGGALFKDVRELYDRGCRELIGEQAASSRSTQSRRLDPDQGMAVAGRVACITMLGARMAVNAETSARGQSGAVTSREIAGDQEIAYGNPFAVNEADVLEVLRSGLFAANGQHFRWSHKSYAEFIAARHIHASDVPTRNKVALVTSDRRVPAALQGVAGWLASLDEAVFREILKMDPEALLQADLSLATDDQKGEIVDFLLRQGESNSPLIREWGMSRQYRKLRHPQLSVQLRHVIELSTCHAARYCAIKIADECEVQDLQRTLAELAIRADEPLDLRIVAASSVASCGTADIKALILPLALRKELPEDEERLQVQALAAVWPQHCSWCNVKEFLGGADYSLTTPLGRFIGFDLATKMRIEDLPEALRWMSVQEFSTDGLSAWARCADRILQRAARVSEDSCVRGAMTDLLHARLSKNQGMFADSNYNYDDHEPWPEITRRMIAADLIARLVPNVYAAVQIVASKALPLLIGSDFDFAVEHWSTSAAAEKDLWQAIIEALMNWENTAASTAALLKTQVLPELHQYLLDWQERRQSQRNRDHQEAAARETAREGTRKERLEQIRELLAAAQTNPWAFWHLLYAMAIPLDQTYGYWPRSAICTLPGWKSLTGDERDQVLRAGKLFINEAEPHLFRGLRTGNPMNYSVAGYWVFFELLTREPANLESIPDHVWKRWTPAITLVQCDLWDADRVAQDRALLAVSVRKAERTVIRTLAIALLASHAHRVTPVMQAIGATVSSTELDERLLRSLFSDKIPGDRYLAGMRMLVKRGFASAVETIEGTVGRIATAPEREMPQLGLNAVLLIHYNGPIVWRALWREIQMRPAFIRQLLNAFRNEGGRCAVLAEELSDDELVELYVWLRTRFGASPEMFAIDSIPEHEMQATIVTVLQKRFRPESVSSLEILERRFPVDWYLRKAAWDSGRQLLDSRWKPLDPELVKRIIADRQQMIVRDEEELMEAVWQSLNDYQALIRTEGSRVMRLWNEPAYTPKNEEPISREIGLELQQMLLGRGVNVTCETKIREGQYVDLYVTSVIPGLRAQKLSLIIEVKGCWHKELKTALETQLAMRYLQDNSSKRGIYLVAWFLCDRWNGDDDGRKSKTPKITETDLHSYLGEQVRQVNAATNSKIRFFILDATVEGKTSKRVLKKRR